MYVLKKEDPGIKIIDIQTAVRVQGESKMLSFSHWYSYSKCWGKKILLNVVLSANPEIASVPREDFTKFIWITFRSKVSNKYKFWKY